LTIFDSVDAHLEVHVFQMFSNDVL